MGNKLKFIFRNFPLAEMHPDATRAAVAAEIAASQGKFWEMHDALYENQEALDPQSLSSYAADLDLNLPQIDGFALLTAMRQHLASAAVPIAVLSSSLSQDDVTRSSELGANRFIVKPIELNDFMNLIAGTVKEMLNL